MAHSEAASAPSFSSFDSQNIDQHFISLSDTKPTDSFTWLFQSPPQIPQSNLIQVTHPGPNQFTNPPSTAHQPSQYPMQPTPSNYHFHSINIQSNPQPSPQYVPVLQVPTVAWTTGLFDCFDDPVKVLVTCCIPCLTFGQIAEIVDSGNTSCATSGLIYGVIVCLIGYPCFLSFTYHTKLRSRYNLIESPAPDFSLIVFVNPVLYVRSIGNFRTGDLILQ